MLISDDLYVSFESPSTVEPRHRFSNIYIYLYVSDQSMFIGSEVFHNTVFGNGLDLDR